MDTPQIRTPWGYGVVTEGTESHDLSGLPPLMEVDELQAAIGSAYSTQRLGWALSAVSASIRDWCRWHVYPSLECVKVGGGDGRTMEIPAVDDIEILSVSVLGTTLDPSDYEWDGRGIVRLRRGTFPDRWRSVEVRYRAGISYAGGLQGAVVNTCANFLAMTPGIKAESLGDQSVTYMGSGVYLTDMDRATLAPYRLFAI